MSFHKQLTHFAFFGGIAFIVDISVLYILKQTLGIYWGRVISFFCAVIASWIFNRNFTFKHSISGLSLIREFIHYLVVMIAGGFVNYLLYAWLVSTYELFAAQPVLGVAAGSCAGMIFNFLSAKTLIFSSLSLKSCKLFRGNNER